MRRSQKSLFMVCPTQQQTRIMEWMESHLEGFKSVSLQDKTSMFKSAPKFNKFWRIKKNMHCNIGGLAALVFLMTRTDEIP